MMASLVLFLDPDHPAKWWKSISKPPNENNAEVQTEMKTDSKENTKANANTFTGDGQRFTANMVWIWKRLA